MFSFRELGAGKTFREGQNAEHVCAATSAAPAASAAMTESVGAMTAS